ncbi:MAG: glycine--tRNA ligase, partial [Candidatus Woesearchaeota archaeon]
MFDFPFGREELWGIANRTDFDLKSYMEQSGKKMTFYDQKEEKHIIPYVIEPSVGVERLLLALLVDAYSEDEISGKKRVYLDINSRLAPYKVAVFPLIKKQP